MRFPKMELKWPSPLIILVSNSPITNFFVPFIDYYYKIMMKEFVYLFRSFSVDKVVGEYDGWNGKEDGNTREDRERIVRHTRLVFRRYVHVFGSYKSQQKVTTNNSTYLIVRIIFSLLLFWLDFCNKILIKFNFFLVYLKWKWCDDMFAKHYTIIWIDLKFVLCPPP